MITVLGCVLLSLFSMPSESAKNYQVALGKSILFYDAQRSGKLPANNPIPWRGDSALHDCVVGGWYDAGDHVKFGLPLSSSLTILGWSLVTYKDGYSTSGQLGNMYDMIKWGYDYILAAWNSSKQELVVQIGDGNADHSFWGRPEDMTMNRPCLVASVNTPASDIAGGSAAALATGFIVFNDKGDIAYANQLLNAAKSLYSFAKSHRGVYSGSQPFYTNTGDMDELCEGAIWLYKATKDHQYLDDALKFSNVAVGWGYGWENKMVGCQALIYQATHYSTFENALQKFFTDVWFPGGDVDYTPCGFAWRDKWGSNRQAANAAFIALIVADYGILSNQTRKWAVEQINYILGDNSHDGGCFSYEIAVAEQKRLVLFSVHDTKYSSVAFAFNDIIDLLRRRCINEIGYGTKYPLRPHHRAASCPTPPASCAGAQTSPGPSPHVLNGGLVGGPKVDDSYQDVRTDYVLNEVTLDYNAGFQGALAGIVHLQASHKFPTTNNKCPCNH